MADIIKKPKTNKDLDDEPSDDDSSSGSSAKGRWNKRHKKALDDDGGGDGSDGGNEGSRKGKKETHGNEDDWKFDSTLLQPPKSYDGSGLAYFQPWLEMLKSEMMSRWETWGEILEILEEVGERRVGPSLTEIIDILAKRKSGRIGQVRNEFLRILKGMTSGDAQSSIVQGTTRNVLDVFRRLISKGKSRTKAAVREFAKRS